MVTISRTSKVPIYVQLRDWLLTEIEKHAEGHKLPTEFELADRFSISRLTVHKVMNELQRTGHVVRGQGRGTFVNRRDKRIHTDAVGGRNGTVILVYPDWFSYDFWGKIEAAERLALRHEFNLVNLKIGRETTYLPLRRLFEEYDDVRGLIVIPPGASVSAATVRLLDGFGVPVVVLIAPDGLPEAANVFTVSQDFGQMGRLDVETLLGQGHRELAYIAAEPLHEGMRQAWAGMQAALHDRGMPPATLQRHGWSTRPWEDSIAQGYTLTCAALERPAVTGFIYDSTPTAIAGLRAIYERGGCPLREYGIAVNSDYFGLERYLWPPVTVVASRLHDIVSQAFDVILAQGKGMPRHSPVSVSVEAPHAEPAAAAASPVVVPT